MKAAKSINDTLLKKKLPPILWDKIVSIEEKEYYLLNKPRGVITSCKDIFRKDQQGTWISDSIIESYTKLYELGLARSVEVWKDQQLVGGLYGVDLGNGIFCGESMFSKESNASKVAFISLVKELKDKNYLLLDCQVYNDHLHNLGAFEIPRTEYMKILLQGNILLRIKKMKQSEQK